MINQYPQVFIAPNTGKARVMTVPARQVLGHPYGGTDRTFVDYVLRRRRAGKRARGYRVIERTRLEYQQYSSKVQQYVTNIKTTKVRTIKSGLSYEEARGFIKLLNEPNNVRSTDE